MIAVLWEEWIFFKRRFLTITASGLIAPLLYLVAFGWGLGRGITLEGQDYLSFILPGIVSLSLMNASFNAVAVPLNIQRLYDKLFEVFILSPLPLPLFVFGKIVAGCLRGLYASSLILTLSLVFRVPFPRSPWFFLIMVLAGLVFAGLGFLIALFVNSHAEMGRFNTFVLVPMMFLCGTFFPVDRFPQALQWVIVFLPLTHVSQGLRAAYFGDVPWAGNIIVLVSLFFVLFWLGTRKCARIEL